MFPGLLYSHGYFIQPFSIEIKILWVCKNSCLQRIEKVLLYLIVLFIMFFLARRKKQEQISVLITPN